MDNRIKPVFLTLSLLLGCLPGLSLGQQNETSEVGVDAQPPVIEPELRRRTFTEDHIDASDFEFTLRSGVVSVEDFGTSDVLSIELGYHITEDYYLAFTHGRAEMEETSFEDLSGSAVLLDEDERQFKYYDFNFGVNFLHGESFIGSRYAFVNNLFFEIGVGLVQFAGEDNFALNYGLGYRFLFNDFVAAHLLVRNHQYYSDLLGREKTTNNPEFTYGVSIFF